MGRAVNWEDEWKEVEGLVVAELGRTMVTGEWSMGEDRLVKNRRVTGRESTTVALVTENSNTLELSQIQPLSLYLDLANCNSENNSKAAWVRVH